MDKSPEAFRTISEVADLLETPAHVLRFWESRFTQIRPVKRAGGRRYYRPSDVALLTGIKYLLHAEGMTIRGVQKVLRDQGIRHVAGLVGAEEVMDIEMDAESALEQALAANFDIELANVVPEPAESATIVALETALWRAERDKTTLPPKKTTLPSDSAMDDDMPTLPGFEFDVAPQKPKPVPSLSDLEYLRRLPAGYFAENDHAIGLLARANDLLERMNVS
jgi:DNA-binding transcriptional MerR regulator